MKKTNTAVLIQTHNNASYISLLAKLNPDVSFYVHVDLKCDDIFHEIKKTSCENIFLLEDRVSVYWGGYSQIVATLKLLHMALIKSNASYYHLMSGECFPLIPFSQMEKIWGCTPTVNFIESHKRPDNEWRMRTWLPFVDTKHMRTFPGRVIKKTLRFISNIVKTSNITDDIFYGSQWFSINRELCQKIVHVYQNQDFFNKFSSVTCSDEHAIQMLVRKFDNADIADNNKRYIFFEDGASSPNYLDEDKINMLRRDFNSEYWFVRKVHEVDMINQLNGCK
ncbi:beta-1,6-N-acetylglucosaminyltransferase [Dryocola sp. BD626]|uniref:beta-1,6-N-acetylglucosaminyltransferase n=1 Tax=Dryocola sp. BD626 TaxID=3133273 RepID=UPI003F5046BA